MALSLSFELTEKIRLARMDRWNPDLTQSLNHTYRLCEESGQLGINCLAKFECFPGDVFIELVSQCEVNEGTPGEVT